MLKKGFIAPSNSPWTSPMFFVNKSDGKMRPVQDYRKLNEWTIKDNYPLPRIEEVIEDMQEFEIVNKFDVGKGYYNILMDPNTRHLAAFKSKFGTYEPTVMPFGLCNALGSFQRYMDRILLPLKNKYPRNFKNYMDDVLIGTRATQAKLLEQITHKFLEVMEKEQLFLNPSKCEFEQTKS